MILEVENMEYLGDKIVSENEGVRKLDKIVKGDPFCPFCHQSTLLMFELVEIENEKYVRSNCYNCESTVFWSQHNTFSICLRHVITKRSKQGIILWKMESE